MTDLVTWLYVSDSMIEPRDEDFEVSHIVNVSRSRNATLAVTGALIFAGNRFSQYIEGPQSAVAELKQSILADERHCNIVTLTLDTPDERQFDGWALAHSGHSTFIATAIDKCLNQRLNGADGHGAQLVKLLKAFC